MNNNPSTRPLLPSNKTAKPALWVLILMAAIGPFGDTEYIPSLPRIAEILDIQYSVAQLTMTSYLLAYALGQLLYGPLSDRFGRRPIMLIGTVVFVLGSLWCYFSTHIMTLIIGRFIQGFGACAGTVISCAAVRDIFAAEERGTTYAKMNAAFALSPALGPIVGGYVDSYFGWNVNFIILFVLSLMLLVTVWRFFPETLSDLNLESLTPRHFTSHYWQLFDSPHYLPLLLITGLSTGIVYACLTEAPALTTLLVTIEPKYYLIIAGSVFTGFVTGSLACIWFSKHMKPTTVIALGLVIMLCASIVMSLFSLNHYLSITSMLAPVAFVFVGIALLFPVATAEALAPFSHLAGTASALLGAFQMGLASLSTVLICLLHDGSANAMPFTFVILTTAATLVFYQFIWKQEH